MLILAAVRTEELIFLVALAGVAIAYLKHRIDHEWFMSNDFPHPITASSADCARFLRNLLLVIATAAMLIIPLGELWLPR